MLLFIDTSDFHSLHFAIIENDTVREFTHELGFNENYKTNALLEKFLKSTKVTPRQLSKIIVCSGPGSFTGIRVGVSLAQALGFALNIPVIAILKSKVPGNLINLGSVKGSTSLSITYGQKPNITPKKINN